MNVKICGITRLDDAQLAITLGTWAIGFNFYAASPRHISVAQAKVMSRQLGNAAIKVGVFVDHPFTDIQKIMAEAALDMAQVYQDYRPKMHDKKKLIYCIADDFAGDKNLKDYAFILFDTAFKKTGLHGGSGVVANWDIAKNLAERYPLILAGGLNAHNVLQGITHVKPFAVDIASGVETAPGIKNKAFLTALMKETQHAKS